MTPQRNALGWLTIGSACLVAVMSFSTCPAADADAGRAIDPYTVFVSQEHAFAKCGPDADDYRTDELRHGQSLEVYGETDGGWLAVRPPETAFCWIPAETVELNSTGDSGTIVEDRTVAWIGTNLGRANQYRWQVQLAEGEPVTVIGRSERAGPDGPQTWLRIDPPSGEFRFVHRDQVVRTSEELVASLRPSADELRERSDLARREQQAFEVASRRSKSGRSTRSPAERSVNQTERQSEVAQASAPEPLRSSRRRDAMELPALRYDGRDAGRSVLDGNSIANEAIGSGLSANVDLAPPSLAPEQAQLPSAAEIEDQRPRGLLHSLAKLGRPRLMQIGATMQGIDPTDPSARNQGAGNQGGWVASGSPETRPVMQVSGVAPMPAQTLVVPDRGLAPITATPDLRSFSQSTTTKAPRVVPASRVQQIRDETVGAGVDSLSLILSRLMAAQASSAETEPVATAASNLSVNASDASLASRARELSARAQQYQQLADRRDGQTIVQSSFAPAIGQAAISQNTITQNTITQPIAPQVLTPQVLIPQSLNPNTSLGSTVASSVMGDSAVETPPDQVVYRGQLVQVYSARPHSPPYALTDTAGRTVAYVTPSPGMNLRTHLNHEVRVIGKGGFVNGLNLPHVLANQMVRVVE